MSGDRYVLRAEGIRKAFGTTEVLTSASVWAEAGKITTLLGRNGSGKTTLLRIAAGVLRADQGMVALDGVAFERHRLSDLARLGLMFLPQGRLLVRNCSVADHFEAVASIAGRDSVEAGIEGAAVGPLLSQSVNSLAGGERARVSLGLALARRPRVLLADEPLVGLAPIDQERLGTLLRSVAEAGVAVVTSGHDTRALLEVSDSVIWSVAGTTHHLGSPADAVQHHQFVREYLGPGFA